MRNCAVEQLRSWTVEELRSWGVEELNSCAVTVAVFGQLHYWTMGLMLNIVDVGVGTFQRSIDYCLLVRFSIFSHLLSDLKRRNSLESHNGNGKPSFQCHSGANYSAFSTIAIVSIQFPISNFQFPFKSSEKQRFPPKLIPYFICIFISTMWQYSNEKHPFKLLMYDAWPFHLIISFSSQTFFL